MCTVFLFLILISVVTPPHPEKRIAVKKEKAERGLKDGKLEKKEEIENDVKLSHLLEPSKSYPRWNAQLFGSGKQICFF